MGSIDIPIQLSSTQKVLIVKAIPVENSGGL